MSLIIPSNTAVCPFRPSIPGATIALTSSTRPLDRKPPHICPPPTTAILSMLKRSCAYCMARAKSTVPLPVEIHEIPRLRNACKCSSVTSSLIMQSNGKPSAALSFHCRCPWVSITMVYSSDFTAIFTDSSPLTVPFASENDCRLATRNKSHIL